MRTVDDVLDELKTQYPIEEEASFNEFDILDKLKENSFKVVMYKELYEKELYEYEKMEMLLEKVTGERYHHYRFEVDEKLSPKEIENYFLPKDKKIIKMKRLMALQKVRVKFFELCWKGLDKMGWSMRNFTERDKMGL